VAIINEDEDSIERKFQNSVFLQMGVNDSNIKGTVRSFDFSTLPGIKGP